MPKIETVGEGQAVQLDELPDVLRAARLRLAGEITWRTVAGRERAFVAMEPDPIAELFDRAIGEGALSLAQ